MLFYAALYHESFLAMRKTMNVLMLSPGYPADMPEFVRGLAEHGATVFGAGDQPSSSLPDLVRRCLSDYVQVRSLWDAEKTAADLRERVPRSQPGPDRMPVGAWESCLLAALRSRFGVEGQSVEQAHRFRDKEEMKRALDGRRDPHAQARSGRQRRLGVGRCASDRLSGDRQADRGGRLRGYLPNRRRR